jgi:hypothetical protein
VHRFERRHDTCLCMCQNGRLAPPHKPVHDELHAQGESYPMSKARVSNACLFPVSQCILSREAKHIVAAFIIEPLGSIIDGRSQPKIAKRSQVFLHKMLDPSGSIISAAKRARKTVLIIEPPGSIICGRSKPKIAVRSQVFPSNC